MKISASRSLWWIQSTRIVPCCRLARVGRGAGERSAGWWSSRWESETYLSHELQSFILRTAKMYRIDNWGTIETSNEWNWPRESGASSVAWFRTSHCHMAEPQIAIAGPAWKPPSCADFGICGHAEAVRLGGPCSSAEWRNWSKSAFGWGGGGEWPRWHRSSYRAGLHSSRSD